MFLFSRLTRSGWPALKRYSSYKTCYVGRILVKCCLIVYDAGPKTASIGPTSCFLNYCTSLSYLWSELNTDIIYPYYQYALFFYHINVVCVSCIVSHCIVTIPRLKREAEAKKCVQKCVPGALYGEHFICYLAAPHGLRLPAISCSF